MSGDGPDPDLRGASRLKVVRDQRRRPHALPGASHLEMARNP